MLTDDAEALLQEDGIRPRAGEIRIFRSSVAEAFFRSPPWLPFAWIPPVIAWLVQRDFDSLPFAIGVVSWFLLEYLMHRFFFHLPGDSRAARGVRLLVHEHHHAHPEDANRLVATPWQAASALGLIGGLAAVFGAPWMSVVAGAACAYLVYEAVHYRIHHDHEGGRLLRALRAHHLRHHHAPDGAKGSFGISSPLGSSAPSRVAGPSGRSAGVPKASV